MLFLLGKLVPTKVEMVGLGGTMNIYFECLECSFEESEFARISCS